MQDFELRDLDRARRYVYQGLWLQRVVTPPLVTAVKPILEWARRIADTGEPLPPVGLVADLGLVAFGMERGEKRGGQEPTDVPGLASTLWRTYEDHVLGKVYGDWSFERASDALRRYEKAEDRDRGLAYAVNQFRKRAGIPGALLTPSILRTMIDASPEEVLAEGKKSLQTEGLMPELERCYQAMVDGARRTPEALDEESIRALENGMALAKPSQEFAHRLIVRAKNELRDGLPSHKVRPLAGRQEVPTRVLDEDTYPVGGFSSISTRGTIESLLHSQLAFMERDARPDLFDVKFLRDELYYYSRDENQFLRRRRSFVFALFPDLVQTRFKDPELSYQRIVYLLAMACLTVEKLSAWLTTDALEFDFLFVGDGGTPLGDEYWLLEMLLREQIANDTVRLMKVNGLADVVKHCREAARKRMVHCLMVSTEDRRVEVEDVVVTRFQIDGPQPAIGHAQDDFVLLTDNWTEATERILQLWV